MARRPGTTLSEVLVALFVLALGMMSLLTLFPLGALQMAQAVKDARSADAATNAAASLRALWKQQLNGLDDTSPTRPAEIKSILDAMDNPNGGAFPGTDTTVRSFAVVVDPIGWFAASGQQQKWLNGNTSGIPRTTFFSLTPATAKAEAIRRCSLLDDITFGKDGLPDTTLGTQVPRDGRYTWAYLLKRKQVARWCEETSMTVLVFSGRTLDVPPTELEYPATFTGGDTRVTVNYAGQKRPAVRKGGWIMDSTTGYSGSPPTSNGNFYRVIAINDTGPTTLEMEIQTPALVTGSTLLVMEGLVEAVEKDDLSISAPPQPN